MAQGEEQVHGGLSVRDKELLPAPPPDRARVARHREAIIFLREFTRELAREVSPLTKLVVALCLIALLGGAIYAGRAVFLAYRAEQQKNVGLIAAQDKKIAEHGEQISVLQELVDRTDRQISALTQTGADLKQATQRINDRFALAQNLWNSYNGGVCLIAGSYIFLDPGTGHPLRYPGENLSEEERMLTMGTEVPLTPSGDGPIFELEFIGSGFHVGDGYVLTNRHVVSQPWAADMHAQLVISDTGAVPKLKDLKAYFPGRQGAIDLKFKLAARDSDLAVCALDGRIGRGDLPALPLDEDQGATAVGKEVLMMGYPTGPDRLLALLPEEEALGLQKEYGASLFVLLEELGRLKLIKPLTTQGHITDLYRDRVVFDALISDGSSGAPLLGESGRVIGVAFAVFIENKASNFAVPIQEGLRLLKKAGWVKRAALEARAEK